MIEHTATPWETSVLSTGLEWAVCMVGGGDQIAMGLTEADANRIVTCVNACKDITTEHLTQFPNWKLAVGNMARPGDVANLILKLGAYREALEAIVHCLEDGQDSEWQSAFSIANEALKP